MNIKHAKKILPGLGVVPPAKKTPTTTTEQIFFQSVGFLETNRK